MARVISSVAGTRTEPKDAYSFVKGTSATFKIIFENEGRPTTVDTGSEPTAMILLPNFLQGNAASPVPLIIASLAGTLTPGQEFEYSFTWEIPSNVTPSDEYIITFQAELGMQQYNFGDEFFTVTAFAGSINTQVPSYATVDDVRKKKFNIDTYLPEIFRKDLDSRNILSSLEDIKNKSDVLNEMLQNKEIGIVGVMYNIETGGVNFLA